MPIEKPESKIESKKEKSKISMWESLTAESLSTQETAPHRGKLHKNLTESIKDIDSHDDRQTLANKKIEDIRFSPLFSKDDYKAETKARLAAYTSSHKNDWFTLDYESVDERHETKVGLGEIFGFDPSITDLVVQKTDGTLIYGERAVINNRVCFRNKATGLYLATFSGDKVRILNEKELSPEEITAQLTKDQAIRTKGRQEYLAYQIKLKERDKIGSKMNELLAAINKSHPNITDKETYRLAAEEAKKQLKTVPEEEQKYLKIVIMDCEKNIEALDKAPKFNLSAYKSAIADIESNHNYIARNDDKGRKKKVVPGKWAFGKYQFISNTANRYGAKLDPQNPESFLKNEYLQETIMNNYTLENLNKILSHGEKTLTRFQDNGYSINQILAAMHFSGSGSIDYANATIKEGRKDWLGGSVATYIKKTETKLNLG
ncbi:hypothetical protein KJ632_01400 [Patescibacteria group bacterium]|nr:hypothetical protein [Patescibacteria group bacterium]